MVELTKTEYDNFAKKLASLAQAVIEALRCTGNPEAPRLQSEIEQWLVEWERVRAAISQPSDTPLRVS